MSETIQAGLTTDPLKRGVQREYRQLMKMTLEALDVELAPASENLVIVHEDMAKLHENLVTVSGQVAGVLKVIQIVRGRLDEIDTGLDEEGDGDPDSGEDGAEA